MRATLIKVSFAASSIHVVILNLEFAYIDMEWFWIILAPTVIRPLYWNLVEVASAVSIILIHLVRDIVGILLATPDPVRLSPLLHHLILSFHLRVFQMHLFRHSEFVHLVVIQKHIDICQIDAKKREDVSRPIDLISCYANQEWLNLLQSVLCWLVKDLCHVHILGLASSRKIFLSREKVPKLIDRLII